MLINKGSGHSLIVIQWESGTWVLRPRFSPTSDVLTVSRNVCVTSLRVVGLVTEYIEEKTLDPLLCVTHGEVLEIYRIPGLLRRQLASKWKHTCGVRHRTGNTVEVRTENSTLGLTASYQRLSAHKLAKDGSRINRNLLKFT